MILFLAAAFLIMCTVSYILSRALNKDVDNPILNIVMSPSFNAVVSLLILAGCLLFKNQSSKIIYLLIWNGIMIANIYSMHKLKNMDF